MDSVCRVCGCTEEDCQQCVERTGEACHWIEFDLCSACAPAPAVPEWQLSDALERIAELESRLADADRFEIAMERVVEQKGGGFAIQLPPSIHFAAVQEFQEGQVVLFGYRPPTLDPSKSSRLPLWDRFRKKSSL